MARPTNEGLVTLKKFLKLQMRILFIVIVLSFTSIYCDTLYEVISLENGGEIQNDYAIDDPHVTLNRVLELIERIISSIQILTSEKRLSEDDFWNILQPLYSEATYVMKHMSNSDREILKDTLQVFDMLEKIVAPVSEEELHKIKELFDESLNEYAVQWSSDGIELKQHIMPSEKSVLYCADSRIGWGFGNQWRGAISSIMLAIASQRSFRIPLACDMQMIKYFDPPGHLNSWEDFRASPASTYTLTFPNVYNTHDERLLRAGDFRKLFVNYQHIYHYTGTSATKSLRANPITNQRLTEAFQTADPVFQIAAATNYLFHSPKASILPELDLYWKDVLVDFDEKLDYLVAIQLRYNVDDPETETRNRWHAQKEFWECTVNILQRIIKMEPEKKMKLFFTTDDPSASVLDLAANYLRPYGSVFMTNSKSFDHSSTNSQEDKVPIWLLDWLTIAKADYLISSGTTYSFSAFLQGIGHKIQDNPEYDWHEKYFENSITGTGTSTRNLCQSWQPDIFFEH